jgi:hypothetical protein
MLEFVGLVILLAVANHIWEFGVMPIVKRIMIERDMRKGIIKYKPCKAADGVEEIDGYSRRLDEHEIKAYSKLSISSNGDLFAIYKYGEDTKIRFTWHPGDRSSSIGKNRACLLTHPSALVDTSVFFGDFPQSEWEFVAHFMSRDFPWAFEKNN